MDEKEHLMASGRHRTFLTGFKACSIKNYLKGALFFGCTGPLYLK